MSFSDTFLGPLTAVTSLPESFVKNVIMDKAKPKVGSILRVDVALGAFSHTGIYLGNNQIVEMYNDDGTGIIKSVTPKEFLEGDPKSLARSGVYIYVACKDTEVLCDPIFAERARKAIGRKFEYAASADEKGRNCHAFTTSCITGKSLADTNACALLDIEIALDKIFHLGFGMVTWRSTGAANGEDFE